MEQFNVSIFTALLAGLLSFASPCVLPLVPGFLSYITGLSLEDFTRGEERSRTLRKALINSLLFVLGFSLVFTSLGASASVLGQLIGAHQRTLTQVAGIGIILLGFHLTGLLKIPFLLQEKRIQRETSTPGLLRSFVVGLFFAFGWTPCVGPILAGILVLAAGAETVSQGIFLLLVYSLGLGIPFVLSALFLNQFFFTFGRIKHHLRKVEVASGALLMGIGFLIFTNQLSLLATRIPFLNLDALLTPKSEDVGLAAAQSSPRPRADFGPYDFRLTTLEGKTLRLSDFGGRVVLVNFWATWCPPCREETPGFIKLHQEYQQQGLVIIGVAEQSPPKKVAQFVTDYQVPYFIGRDEDGSVAQKYGVRALPQSFLFAPDGKLYHKFMGYAPENLLRSKLKEILGSPKEGQLASE
ncbi:MAG: redoxin domain-containing protein [Candidatus Tectomicrobia bacterium]|uniref:Redoxin domain-containing protein n=1 Tax=Tectimicrobiota bacterium TaxID=2528274 RepID=A0A932CP39_UNCTE|nr:redoxin domain-containing protein [Candidatus Tectomicrobia bacterium]